MLGIVLVVEYVITVVVEMSAHLEPVLGYIMLLGVYNNYMHECIPILGSGSAEVVRNLTSPT